MANSSKEEVAVTIDEEETNKGPPPRRSVLQRVPAPLRVNEKQKHIYEPAAVPLGPYHHCRLPEYQLAEQLKEELLNMVCSDRDRGLPLGLVTDRLAEIRQFYVGADEYGNEELATMMLRDTCFVLCCIKLDSNYMSLMYERLGVSGVAFVKRDLFMLENQIPLWLVSLLTPFAFDDDGDLKFHLHRFLSMIHCDGNMATPLLWSNGQGEEPLHLLEASHRMLLRLANTDQDEDDDQGSIADRIYRFFLKKSADRTNREPPESNWRLHDSPHRSATDLKAKGVHFGPSSHSLKDITFFSFSTHGRLHLPLFFVNHYSRAYLSNFVAYEMSSDGDMDLGVTRYVNFMKTLLHRGEDVKLLREKGILYSVLANNDDVVRLFQDIDTYGMSDQADLYDVRMRMEEHCNNKGKTWLAELINAYFRSPLTAVALFAAAFILALTFLQTFYTINPKYANAANSR